MDFGGFLSKLFLVIGPKILTSLGIGIASGTILFKIVDYYIAKIIANAGFLSTGAFLFNLAGIDIALSIVIGAVVVRATLSAMGVVVTKIKTE